MIATAATQSTTLRTAAAWLAIAPGCVCLQGWIG
jgi:hypothetical protein